MGTIEKSFVPILDALLLKRVDRCVRDFDDKLFACHFGINASVVCYTTSHYIHTDDALGTACKLHCLKATHDFLAAFQLARSSMHSQAANAIRLACETSWQNTAFHELPSLAENWTRGQKRKPAQVRSDLRRFRQQRRFLYQHLSELAHPNREAMLVLDPWDAGHKEVALDALLPLYEKDQIARTLRALFVAQFLALMDFDANHLSLLPVEQQLVFGVQGQKMGEYYRRVVEAQLPLELRGLTLAAADARKAARR
jgi:hypothetical protein